MKIKNRFGQVMLEIETTFEADLQGAQLQDADLRRADLQEADLRRADLRGSDLWRTQLQGTDLQEADLRRADLRGSDLWRAHLQGADLRGAQLQGAHLQGADLRGADLDFSCLPLWCGSFGMKVNTRFVWQLIAHIGRLDTKNVSKKAQKALRVLRPYYNEFCRYRNDIEKI